MKEWIYFEKALADEVCEGLLKDIKIMPMQNGTVGIENNFQVSEKSRRSKINKRGTAIFFTPFTYHSISPVTRGTRYSLTAWFEGPKWR